MTTLTPSYWATVNVNSIKQIMNNSVVSADTPSMKYHLFKIDETICIVDMALKKI